MGPCEKFTSWCGRKAKNFESVFHMPGLQAADATSLRDIAAGPNLQGIPMARKDKRSAVQIARVQRID
jgi:hypothetical protein